MKTQAFRSKMAHLEMILIESTMWNLYLISYLNMSILLIWYTGLGKDSW